jgi:hypothetical protein
MPLRLMDLPAEADSEAGGGSALLRWVDRLLSR